VLFEKPALSVSQYGISIHQAVLNEEHEVEGNAESSQKEFDHIQMVQILETEM
jgi:hypothetical protein